MKAFLAAAAAAAVTVSLAVAKDDQSETLCDDLSCVTIDLSLGSSASERLEKEGRTEKEKKNYKKERNKRRRRRRRKNILLPVTGERSVDSEGILSKVGGFCDSSAVSEFFPKSCCSGRARLLRKWPRIAGNGMSHHRSMDATDAGKRPCATFKRSCYAVQDSPRSRQSAASECAVALLPDSALFSLARLSVSCLVALC